MRWSRIEEANDTDVVLEIGVARIGARAHNDASSFVISAQLFFSFNLPKKSRLPSGTPLVRRMS